MTLSTLEARLRNSQTPRAQTPRALRWVMLAVIAGFVTTVAVKAILQTFDQDDFPEDLLLKVELMPVIFPIHMFTGALALALVPLALLLRPWRRWHRIAGRIAVADVLVAGATAYPVALIAPVTPWSAAGFTAQASLWLIFLVLGVWNIRRGRTEHHRLFMLLMTATASGAIFFRVYLASWVILAQGKHFAVFYACDAWIAWLLPLLTTWAFAGRAGGRRSQTGEDNRFTTRKGPTGKVQWKTSSTASSDCRPMSSPK